MGADVRPVYLIAAGVAVLGIAYVMGKGAGTIARDAASAAVDMVDGVVAGTVESIGEKVGIPRTNESEGQRAWNEGRYWDASFLLPAGDFISNVWHKAVD